LLVFLQKYTSFAVIKGFLTLSFCANRFQVYAAGASSLQADSYSKMGKLNSTNFPWCHQLSYIKPQKWLCLTSYVTQVISVFVLVGVIFVPIGIVSLRASQQVCPISCLLGLKYKLHHFVYVGCFLCCRLSRLLIGMMMHVSLLV